MSTDRPRSDSRRSTFATLPGTLATGGNSRDAGRCPYFYQESYISIHIYVVFSPFLALRAMSSFTG
jgi:hypothetical protein